MSLELTYEQLKREVARSIGANRNPDNWSDNEKTDIDDGISSGLRMFYFNSQNHIWEFLCPEESISIVSGTTSYDLPKGFVRMMSEVTIDNPLSFITNSALRAIQDEGEKGTPVYYSIKTSDENQSRHEIIFYPSPNENFTATMRILLLPSIPENDAEVLAGGAIHGETIIAACVLGVAMKVAQEEQEIAALQQSFQTKLESSIQSDRDLFGVVE